MQSRQFRLRLVATVTLAMIISLISSAMLATPTKHTDKKHGAKPEASKPAKRHKNANKKVPRASGQNSNKKNQNGNANTNQNANKPSASNSNTPEEPCDASDEGDKDPAGLRVKLFYMREATKIAAVLATIAKRKTSNLHCLVVAATAEDEIILYGPQEKREAALRVIAALDLPRPGIDMEMWGIQISSNSPEQMARVLPAIRDEIDRTQQAVRWMYAQMQRLAQEITVDRCFEKQIQETLDYRSALDAHRPLSFTDILLRMVAAQNPLTATHKMATELDWEYQKMVDGLTEGHEKSLKELLGTKKPKRLADSKASTVQARKPAFENFFLARGLQRDRNAWVDRNDGVKESALMGRMLLLDFGLHYARLIHQPGCFSPYYLQQAAESLNPRLQTAIDALNLDIQTMFVEPTLMRIQELVLNFTDVKYAQVGKTSVASLNGITTEVTSHSVSAFDVTPPLRLSELLTKAKSIADQASPFIPTETKPGAAAATELTTGALPISQVIGLIGALGEERSVWRELQSGISLKITPNVLRNMTSAELQIDLKTGDPQAGTRDEKVPPLSRVSQHDVKTSVYVNALDFFDLSAFISQSTLDGGRGYVPLIGPVWHNLFSEVPGVGGLFSWRKSPQTVYHQSLVLTNSFITPTTMGIALLYPTDTADFNNPCDHLDTNDFNPCDNKQTNPCDYRQINPRKADKTAETSAKSCHDDDRKFKCRKCQIDEYNEKLKKEIDSIREARQRPR
jgi:hypothetical protein